MTATRPAEPLAGDIGGVADNLARASLAVARRFATGGTMWCCSPTWAFHAHHLAVEFVHPVIVGKRALSAVTVPPGADLVATLRASVLPGDIVVALAPGDDEAVTGAMQRGEAWGVETVWIGAGPRPAVGTAAHLLWLDTDDELLASERFVRLYHMLWELTHVCFEHPGLLKEDPAGVDCTEDVCITCSDEAVLAEIVSVHGDEALVRAGGKREEIDISCVDTPAPGDLVLVHAGTAIGIPSNSNGSTTH
jgi:hydrogenase maturation factor